MGLEFGLGSLEREMEIREKKDTKLLNKIQTQPQLHSLSPRRDEDNLPSPIK